jgi:outer membrane protein assembly factor BamA
VVVLVLALVAGAATAHADDGARDAASHVCGGMCTVVGFRVRGTTKVTRRTVGYLAHLKIGDHITPDSLLQIAQAMTSSELFDSVTITLEDAEGGVYVVATLDDKRSWIVAPTVFWLPGNHAVGAGYAENDLGGEDRKLLLYGQLSDHNTFFFGTYLDPAFHGSRLSIRTDLYLLQRLIDEYANPANDPRSFAVQRSTTETFLDAGILAGWTFYWWLVGDLRVRGAYVYFRDTHAHDANETSLAQPQHDGWDVSTQARITLDARGHSYGISWGPFLQATLETTIPGLDSYGYQFLHSRAYYSWRLFQNHELELRGNFNIGYHIPFHEDPTTGGSTDLRGYEVDQFRGDVRATARVEYSIPLFRYKLFTFRALGFYDGGYAGFHFRRDDRIYLPSQLGPGVWRDDAGIGLRVYVSSIVLPLLGLDLGYGIEGHSPEVYFEVGLTDF